MNAVSTPLVVRYAETDAQGVVHHSNYLVWFEEGRSDFLRQKGLNYTAFEKAGFFIVVAEAQVRYRNPAFYEDRLIIKTTLERAKGMYLEFSYQVLNELQELVAEGKTRHLVIGKDRRPVSLPDDILEKIQ